MIVGYCRAGFLRAGTSLALQERHLAAAGAQEFFRERGSFFGSRPALERAIQFARRGDVIVVTRSYRLACSKRSVMALIRRLGHKGVGLRILDTPVDTSTTTGRMILGSAPLWSLGISPLAAVLRDLAVFWRPRR